MVFGSAGYPQPKSPYLLVSSAISLSLSTFAIIEAAETMGYVLSALCSETISTLKDKHSKMCCLYRSSKTSEAST